VHSKTELHLALHNRRDSLSVFILITTNNGKTTESASFTSLVTKRLLRPVNLEMVQLLDLYKCYVQTVFTFWTTLVVSIIFRLNNTSAHQARNSLRTG
jgi:uncharacterized protein YybS (DUF2232 family)